MDIKNITTIDLFAGAGGITEGFRQAGATCVFANDFNPYACETFRHNHPSIKMVDGPIQNLDAKAIRKGVSMRKGDLDVLVGGPPCQGFSINAPERFLEDPRNSLFKHYLRFVDEFSPKTFMFENVPGMLSLGGAKNFRYDHQSNARAWISHQCSHSTGSALWSATGSLENDYPWL